MVDIVDYDLDRQIGYLLRRAYQRHTTIFQHEIPDDRLTSAQFATMITIHRLEAAPLVQISAMAGIDHATLRDIVTRLRKRGLLDVIQDRQDRRQRIVSLTAEGRMLVENTIPSAIEVTERTLAPLDMCERVAALHILSKLAFSEE
ncbi:MarR family transcriptional regulator [Komagataeibacter rhaeticus]|uniref:MarR family winged helix-turn-helix transcriptional regulator n=1 Tax=Komagataeibacter rhaeticus TaxID=215221 RepID=UPI000207FB6E|nr:MarR family transcriptional regulator [Komagataeibacter rhaeticus]ATU71512.1 MarR family transcriptional regulator [Komagataeibacter xylinus]EGG78082.1 Transcriptional regulator hosA [Gluconacetobacter sp. SXCC-1]KDU96701.1 MarR family transcriptional regulator [Komagataeibacter rhaeticus AF1]MBL7239670.1 MarR family transcriptional regulator [Komagataeibacter rhaeticus]PYD53124.1 MarR family transcriptional regulator [Komagataeibacter rhaeticus]